MNYLKCLSRLEIHYFIAWRKLEVSLNTVKAKWACLCNLFVPPLRPLRPLRGISNGLPIFAISGVVCVDTISLAGEHEQFRLLAKDAKVAKVNLLGLRIVVIHPHPSFSKVKTQLQSYSNHKLRIFITPSTCASFLTTSLLQVPTAILRPSSSKTTFNPAASSLAFIPSMTVLKSI